MARRRILLGIAWIMLLVPGCHSNDWPEPKFARSYRAPLIELNLTGECLAPPQLELAEKSYAHARKLHRHGHATSVDSYYQVLKLTWPLICHERQHASCEADRAWKIYHSSLNGLISAAACFGRMELPHGIRVNDAQGVSFLPITFQGFVWSPEDVNEIVLVGDYSTKELTTVRCDCGLGVPLVIIRKRCHDELLYYRETPFAATAIVRPSPSGAGDDFRLELYDPLRVEGIADCCGSIAIRRDLAAPLLHGRQFDRDPGMAGFLTPGATQRDSGLKLIEPYQPGKIPVVFIHGLLSDPATWVAMASELRYRPEFIDRYQLWVFQYPTGQPFLGSAADLREQLATIRSEIDPTDADPVLDEIVLIGHSMGGLIAKLQVTHSDCELWNSFSRVPFESLVAKESTKSSLARSFFFQPSPSVSRVVYIGTPHRGSDWASRSVGLLASQLVNEPPELQALYDDITQNNPGALSEELQDGIPTSVDLMQPDSQLLLVLDGLRLSDRVRRHNIIGNGRCMFFRKKGDGVVTTESARQFGVESELLVPTTHNELQRSEQAIREVNRILTLHALETENKVQPETIDGF